MTLRELVVKWDNQWRYDYWWREKHNIPFNSKAHREANQRDIAFEYMENHLSNKAIDKYKNDEDKKHELEKTGQWMKEGDNSKKIQEAFDKIDIKDF